MHKSTKECYWKKEERGKDISIFIIVSFYQGGVPTLVSEISEKEYAKKV